MTELNKDLLETSEIYRNIAALSCFSNEIAELEKEIAELNETFNSDAYLPDEFIFYDEDGIKKAVKYNKEFYPWEHECPEEIYSETLKDVKSGFWGEPFVISE